VFGGRIIKLGLGFVIQIVMARLLGVDSYGTVILATMVVGVSTLLAEVGLKSGILRKLAHYEDEPENARGIVKAGFQIGLGTGVLASVLLFAAAPLIARQVFENPSLVPVLRVAALGVPFTVLMEIAVSTARGIRDAKTHVIINQILSTTLSAVFVAALLVAGLGAVGAVLGRVLSFALSAGAAAVLAYRALPFDIRGRATRKHSELFLFSLPLLLARGSEWLLAQTDTFLIGTFLSAGSVGLYNVVFRLQSLGMVFFYPVTFLLPPVLTRLMKADDEQAAAETYQVATKWMTLLTLPLFLLVFMFPKVVIGVPFGSAYVKGATALRILIIPIIVTTFLGANGAALLALGHNRINMYVTGGTAVLNVLLNLALIPQFGIVGAAVATTTSRLGRDFVYTGLLYRWYSIHSLSWSMLRPLAGAAVLVPAGYVGFTTLFEPSMISVTVVGILFLCIYLPLTIALGGIQQADIDVFERLESSAGVDLTRVRQLVNYFQPG
jgi:O-antigen/teichoic acid export membrane protein